MKYLNSIAILFLISCSGDDSNNYSTSACAKQMSDGSIQECIPDIEVMEDLTKAMEFFQKLDKEMPGPIFPGLDKQYKVIKATKHGLLELDDGRVLLMAGLKCDHNGLKKYLDATLVKDKNMKIVFLPTGLEINKKIYAYIWEVNIPKELINSDVDFSNSMNQVADTALSSQWCKPIRQDKHDYHLRYSAIADLN